MKKTMQKPRQWVVLIHIVKLIECHDACSFVNAVYYVQSSNVVIFCSSMHLSKKINNKAEKCGSNGEGEILNACKLPVFFQWKLGFVKLNNLNSNIKVDLTLFLITFIHGFCHIIPKRILLISWFQLFRSTLHLLDAEGSCTTPDLHSADEMGIKCCIGGSFCSVDVEYNTEYWTHTVLIGCF